METSVKRNFAVFIDMENVGGKRIALETIIETLKIRGDIWIGRVYGYSDRYSDLREVLLSNTFTAVPSLRYGSSQKNSLDIQLVVDALDVAYTNPKIDSFCIVSGDSDCTPLVGKLKSMGKYVLGISRSESASNVFISACNEFLFLESVRQKPAPRVKVTEDADDEEQALLAQIETILAEQTDAGGYMLASVLKDILTRLRPDFSERQFGHNLFGRLLVALEEKYGTIHCETDRFNLKVCLATPAEKKKPADKLKRGDWIDQVQDILDRLKQDGFERVNPSIIKESIRDVYPDFTERAVGYRKFSDMMKVLERERRIRISADESANMLITIL